MSQQFRLIDTHVDTPYRLIKNPEDISKRTEGGHFDCVRARQGGLDAVFMVAFVPPDYEEKRQARDYAEKLIDSIHGFAQKWPDQFVMARSASEVKAQFDDERISIIVGLENGGALEGDLAAVQHFYDRGVRYITLCHGKNNHICDSSFDSTRSWHGLSPFGREVVAEMNRVGMIVDISHVSDDTFYQVVELSQAPIVATHSSCRHFTPGCERNMNDEMIQTLAAKGGVMGINFGAIFLSTGMNQAFTKFKAEMEDYFKTHPMEYEEKERFVLERRKAANFGKAYLADAVAHIDHVVNLVGIDHVGIGSDFDGVLRTPEGLEDVSCYPNLIAALGDAGYPEVDICKICSENFLRVWTEIEQHAAPSKA